MNRVLVGFFAVGVILSASAPRVYAITQDESASRPDGSGTEQQRQVYTADDYYDGSSTIPYEPEAEGEAPVLQGATGSE